LEKKGEAFCQQMITLPFGKRKMDVLARKKQLKLQIKMEMEPLSVLNPMKTVRIVEHCCFTKSMEQDIPRLEVNSI